MTTFFFFFFTLVLNEIVSLWGVILPLLVVQLVKVITMLRNILEISSQFEELFVFFTVQVTVAKIKSRKYFSKNCKAVIQAIKPERFDAQSWFRVHQEISSDVIKHDRVLAGVLLQLSPNDSQRFHFDNATFWAVNGDHCWWIAIAHDFVIFMSLYAKKLHLFNNPLQAGGGPNHNLKAQQFQCSD